MAARLADGQRVATTASGLTGTVRGWNRQQQRLTVQWDAAPLDVDLRSDVVCLLPLLPPVEALPPLEVVR